MRVRCLPLLLTAAVALVTVNAEVLFDALMGKTFTGGRTFSIAWKDDGNEPKVVITKGFTLDLCTGSNSDIYPLITLVAGETFLRAQGTVSAKVPPGVGGNGASYFLRMTWAAAEGTVVSYSQRFAMAGMTGVFGPRQIQANAVGDTAPPQAEHPVQAPATSALTPSALPTYTPSASTSSKSLLSPSVVFNVFLILIFIPIFIPILIAVDR
ncbi:hypothetical protein Dda_2607 [Drechslerella dactyloides]|uniref:Yeast cell wall synthesis Kre9/Knh1-like N-terminal domain-containing protein n=1 Tax=Drechslerella dactyloides TaxID=74499 RepID=A0AAD6IZT7_DREDA|nr:hypothetical protein Dda_2607 [Drechslerella dactyloides]